MKHECKFVVFPLKTAIFTASVAGLNLHQFQKKIIWWIIGPISIDQTPNRFKKHTLKFDHSTLIYIAECYGSFTLTHRLWHFLPRLSQSIHRRIGERRTNLQHSVEIVQTPTNIRHRSPFFDCRHTGCHVCP
jgi:hypothetical protein